MILFEKWYWKNKNKRNSEKVPNSILDELDWNWEENSSAAHSKEMKFLEVFDKPYSFYFFDKTDYTTAYRFTTIENILYQINFQSHKYTNQPKVLVVSFGVVNNNGKATFDKPQSSTFSDFKIFSTVFAIINLMVLKHHTNIVVFVAYNKTLQKFYSSHSFIRALSQKGWKHTNVPKDSVLLDEIDDLKHKKVDYEDIFVFKKEEDFYQAVRENMLWAKSIKK